MTLACWLYLVLAAVVGSGLLCIAIGRAMTIADLRDRARRQS